jgi:molybdopterin-guanine dinucleotide biosynthesis protein A
LALTVAGFVVAGGESRRMGRDKALLPWGEVTLLDHAVRRLEKCCDEVRILCGPRPRYTDRGFPTHVDAVPGAGALGGILTGLQLLQEGLGLFLAIDVPRVPVALLRRLIELSEGFDAVVPVSPTGPEPMCAVYGPGCLDPVRRQVAAGELRIIDFWPKVRLREVGLEELAAFGDPADLFLNINTNEDYEASRTSR